MKKGHEEGHFVNKCPSGTKTQNTKVLHIIGQIPEKEFQNFRMIQEDTESESDIYSLLSSSDSEDESEFS